MQAQGSLRAVLDSTQGTVATPFTISLEAKVSGAKRIEIQPFPDEDSSGFVILKSENLEQKQEGDVLNWKGKIWLLGVKEGLSEIPPLTAIIFGNNSSAELQGNPLQINLLPAKIDTSTQLKPIIEPRDAPYTVREFLPYIILAILLIGLGLLIWRFTQKKKVHEEQATIVLPPDPPIVIARKKLTICRQKALWKEQQYKTHYSAVTEILREYIENRLSLPALESTSYETINLLKKDASIDRASISQLDRFFQEADLVKFAKEPATEASSVALLEEAERWLNAVHEKLDPVREEGGEDAD
jgi:hypothetical protein